VFSGHETTGPLWYGWKKNKPQGIGVTSGQKKRQNEGQGGRKKHEKEVKNQDLKKQGSKGGDQTHR